MLIQKLYKNGNSVAVTIPKEYLKELNLKEGSEVTVEKNDMDNTVIISPKNKKGAKSSITPKFIEWLESFNKEYGVALAELAKR